MKSMGSSDSERSDGEINVTGVELGFLKRLDIEERWRLHRCYFPSKLGGKPAWLDPQNLPPLGELKCRCCGKQLVFLLQIYAPNDASEDAFHRTIFVFCCKTEGCYKENSNEPFCVLRCQLRRENEYYNPAPPEYESPSFYESCKEFRSTCNACGCRSGKLCSRCHRVSYCSKEHQTLDWKTHKMHCGVQDKVPGNSLEAPVSLLFPEDEIVIESEEVHDGNIGTDDSPLPHTNPGRVVGASFSPSELEQFANFNDADEQFAIFRKTTAHSADQVLRYEKTGEPLWCASENQLKTENVPKCHCGSPRHFEFQIMPQLLSHLGIQTSIQGPSIDWGVLAIYTCSEDCVQEGKGYFQEYLYKQDFSPPTTD